VVTQYIDDVLKWLEQYRVATACEVNDEIGDLNDKIADLSSKNKELENELLRYKAAAAFSQVTIEELDKERRQIPSAKKELKKSIQRVLLKYNK